MLWTGSIMISILWEILTSLPLIRRPLLMTTARAKSEDCTSTETVLLHGTIFLTQIGDVPTREENTLDLVLTNCPQYIHEVQSEKLPISDHNLVSVTAGFDWRTLTSDRTGGVFPDPDSFGSLNCYEGDYQKMGSLLEEVNRERLRDCCIDSGDDDGSMFMELIRLPASNLLY